MKTAYVGRGHIEADGTIVLDEPAELTPGPVQVTIMHQADETPQPPTYTPERHMELMARLASIAALDAEPSPDDGLTAKDYKTILYGSEHRAGDVR